MAAPRGKIQVNIALSFEDYEDLGHLAFLINERRDQGLKPVVESVVAKAIIETLLLEKRVKIEPDGEITIL